MKPLSLTPPPPRPTSAKKMKTATMPTKESTPTPSLTHDLLLSLIARISRSDYPSLSRVSKSIRSLIASPELYQTRALLGHTESCLYVSLLFFPDPKPCWFILPRIPDCTSTKMKNKSCGDLLEPLPSPNSPVLEVFSNHVAVGSNIYKIGGDIKSTSRVSVLDCKTHKWNEAPSMHVDRSSSSTARLVDGKIYVAGGCNDRSSVYWVEAFDPKTQSWSSIPNPSAEILAGDFVTSLGLEGKLYLFGYKMDKCEIYDPKEGRWNSLGFDTDLGFRTDFLDYSGYYVIENVLYFWYYGDFYWHDSKVTSWRKLKGVEGLPRFRHRELRKMVDCGGKMVLLWGNRDIDQENTIWCAVIALEKRHEDGFDEMWGKVEWCDVVLTLPKSRNLWTLDAVYANV